MKPHLRILVCLLALTCAPGAPAAAAPRPVPVPSSAAAAGPENAAHDPVWTAWAQYRAGLEARESGDADGAIRHFTAATLADPQWADPHFSLAWSYLFRDPSETGPELLRAAGLLAGAFRFEHILLFHLFLWGMLAVFLAVLGVGLCAIARGLPDLHHRLGEFFGGYLDRSYAAGVAALAVVLPFTLGLGVVLPMLFLLALLQPSLRGPAKRAWALVLVAALGLPWLIREADSLLLPRVPSSWVGIVVRAHRAPWDPKLAAALDRAEAEAQGRYEIPFSRGVLEMRDGRFGEAMRDFTRADSLQHNNARTLNNLAVAEWMLGRPGLAQGHFQDAIKADDRLTSPHYNLAQVLSRDLDFEGANREMLRAGSLDFERLRRHFNAFGTGPALMMQEELSSESLWKLWREETSVRGDWMEPPAWLAGRWETRTGLFALLALVFLVLGSAGGHLLTRWLPTYECANCGDVLCRRCSGRRRGETFCKTCLDHMSVANGGPFARVLLERRRASRNRERGAVALILGLVCPPYGRALENRWFECAAGWLAFALLGLASVRGGVWIHAGPNFTAGLHSGAVTALLACAWTALWAPLAVAEWRTYDARRRLMLAARPVALDKLDKAA